MVHVDCVDPIVTSLKDHRDLGSARLLGTMSDNHNGIISLKYQYETDKNLIHLFVETFDRSNQLDAFGLRLIYSDTYLTFVNATPGDFIRDWEVFGFGEYENMLTIGGFDPFSTIAPDVDCDLAVLSFELNGLIDINTALDSLEIVSLTDDIERYAVD